MIIYKKPASDNYSPNIFIRAGLFILTLMIALSVIGLLSLLLGDIFISNAAYWLFLGLCCYFALELSVSMHHHCRSGVDDALLWLSGGLVLGGLVMLTDKAMNGNEEQMISALVLVLSFYLTLRFADLIMAAVCYLSLIAFFFFGWARIPVWGMATMPFLIMIVAVASYFSVQHYSKKTEQPAYQKCLTIVCMLTLLVLYAAGNYFVVQCLNPTTEISPLTDGAAVKPIPFALFFWCWTVLVPLLYIAFGLKRKDVILLRMGLLLLAAATFTVRYYYHVLDIEWALTLGGLVLVGIAYAAYRYLKVPRHGFTADELENNNQLDKLIGESLVISETVNTAPNLPIDHHFGGGSFGGGGASSNF
ncbi:membrane protein YdbS with pleckstrin-like domain [Pedobacter sp. UYP24]